jgi:hypothetical protein
MPSRSIYMYGTLFLLAFRGFRSRCEYLNVHLCNEITIQTRKILKSFSKNLVNSNIINIFVL